MALIVGYGARGHHFFLLGFLTRFVAALFFGAVLLTRLRGVAKVGKGPAENLPWAALEAAFLFIQTGPALSSSGKRRFRRSRALHEILPPW